MATKARLIIAATLIGMICSGWAATAQEFRIETDIFVAGEKEPVGETLTIFTNGLVYDFLLTDDEEITLFDRERNRLVLMDTKRQIKTELTMDSMTEFVARMKAQLREKPEHQYLLSENVEVEIDDEGWVKLANERMCYRAECVKPKDKSIALEYQEFADWYARLNAMRRRFVPFLRIELNAEIAKRGLIPKTIERTITDKKVLTDKVSTVRSQHLANWRLSNNDRKMIERAGTYLVSFPTVAFLEYVDLSNVDQHDQGR